LNLRASELRAAGHDVISLGQALPFYGPPPSALAAARQALETREVNIYSTDPGMPALRTALAGTSPRRRHCLVGRRHHHHGGRQPCLHAGADHDG
jgi:aspartate/methionine/tyrosine aminotransferase